MTTGRSGTGLLTGALPLMSRPLDGKVAIVTGASSGIGLATAVELAARGAKVAVSARRKKMIEALEADLEFSGHTVLAMTCDVTCEDEVAAFIDATVAQFGRIDIAFNNAGTEGTFAPFIDQDNASYDLVFEPNVRGVFLCMKHQARVMLAEKSGSIINNASMGGIIGFANAALYIATKHAVIGLTKTASLEWYRQGVRVNALCPGIIDTPFQDRNRPTTEAKNAFAAGSVPGRAGTPEEMARIVAFLGSDDASFITGHSLLADGGYTAA
jgi:NAD(P)-dependent dehydrogenase (short-subunit alcohol dehydrogenase family)